MKTIDIIGVQMDLGASRRGVNMGPMAIRYGGLCEGLEQLGFAVNDLGDIAPLVTGATAPYMRNYEQVIELNRRLYQMVAAALEQDHFPVVLGGDHSIAAGSISAAARHYRNIGVIWIDAHGDWNNEGIHLSFDIDAIDPQAAPGTGTVVHSGLTVREAFLAVESLADSGKLVSMDMVEVNPILDERNKTAILASQLIQSALGKAVY